MGLQLQYSPRQEQVLTEDMAMIAVKSHPCLHFYNQDVGKAIYVSNSLRAGTVWVRHRLKYFTVTQSMTGYYDKIIVIINLYYDCFNQNHPTPGR